MSSIVVVAGRKHDLRKRNRTGTRLDARRARQWAHARTREQDDADGGATSAFFSIRGEHAASA